MVIDKIRKMSIKGVKLKSESFFSIFPGVLELWRKNLRGWIPPPPFYPDRVKVYAENVQMLAPLARTQLKENVNAMVAAKVPESQHYSDTNSLNVHVSAAVCQNNMGQLYLCSIFGKAGLQNDAITQQLAKKFVERAKKGCIRRYLR